MPTMTTDDLAEAVATHLRSLTLSRAFEPAPGYLPRYTREYLEQKGMQVDVVPAEDAMELMTRGSVEEMPVIHIAVHDVACAQDREKMRGLLQLMKEIQLGVLGERLTAGDQTAVCEDVTNKPIYDVAMLEKYKIFRSVIQAHYKFTRAF